MVAQPVCQGSPAEAGEDGAPIGGAVQEGETREGGAEGIYSIDSD